MNNDTTSGVRDYDTRIKLGREKEDLIITNLRKLGLDIIPSKEDDDKYNNVDAWIRKDGKEFPIQVKHREGGDDLIFELVKDITAGKVGRDMKGKAEYYLYVNRNGDGRIYNLTPIKKFLNELKQYGLTQFKATPSKREWAGKEWQLKVREDNAYGNLKLMAYIHPTAFPAVIEWKKLI